MTDTLIPDREQARTELTDLRLRTDLFIDGEFRPPRDGRRFVTENPAPRRMPTSRAIELPGLRSVPWNSRMMRRTRHR